MGGRRVTDGIFVLLVLGTFGASDAREIMTSGLSSREIVTFDSSVLQINYPDSDGEGKALQVIGTNANKCVFLCEAFAAMALKFLKQSKTPIEMFNTLRESCSQMGSYEQQCTTMVNLFGSQLIMEIGTMQPGFLCGKFIFSEHNTLMTSSLLSLDQYSLMSLDGCQICHGVVADAIVQLKDHDTMVPTDVIANL